MNQIEDVCKDIEKTINQTIQTTLNQLEKDCDEIGALVDQAVAEDNAARAYNLRASGKGFMLLFLGITLPIAMAINFFASSLSDKFLKDTLGKDGMESLKLYLVSGLYFISLLFVYFLPRTRRTDGSCKVSFRPSVFFVFWSFLKVSNGGRKEASDGVQQIPYALHSPVIFSCG